MENAWSVFLSAALGGSGLVGLVVWSIKRRVERRAAVQAAELKKKEDTRQKIAAVLVIRVSRSCKMRSMSLALR